MRHYLVLSALGLVLSAMAGTASFAAVRAEAGRLDCDVSAGLGLIVGSEREVSCTFVPTGGGVREDYKGKITEFGLDIGEISKAKLVWLVFAPAQHRKDALAGTYTGVSADAALGLGVGAKILVGGENGTVSLQPLSIEGEEGINIAAGISALTLRPDK